METEIKILGFIIMCIGAFIVGLNSRNFWAVLGMTMVHLGTVMFWLYN